MKVLLEEEEKRLLVFNIYYINMSKVDGNVDYMSFEELNG